MYLKLKFHLNKLFIYAFTIRIKPFMFVVPQEKRRALLDCCCNNPIVVSFIGTDV